jgi:hypothetical protein
MSKIQTHNDTIDQGHTFYIEVEVFPNERFTVEQIRAMTPFAWLLNTAFTFGCSWTSDTSRAVAAVAMPRDTTTSLDKTRAYPWRMSVKNDTDTIPVVVGSMSVREG